MSEAARARPGTKRAFAVLRRHWHAIPWSRSTTAVQHGHHGRNSKSGCPRSREPTRPVKVTQPPSIVSRCGKEKKRWGEGGSYPEGTKYSYKRIGEETRQRAVANDRVSPGGGLALAVAAVRDSFRACRCSAAERWWWTGTGGAPGVRSWVSVRWQAAG
jgi:hypothetical protein